MNRIYLIASLIIMMLLGYSCQTTETEEKIVFDLQLTEEEKEAGVLTPEILWKFRRMGSIAPSPDGSTVLFTLTDYNLENEARRTNIFSMDAGGGDPVQLTEGGGG